MKRFSFFAFLSIGLCASALYLSSCQKETLQTVQPDTQQNIAGDRAPVIFGVSVFRPNNPSQLFSLDAATGNVLNAVGVFYVDANGNQIAINDLKGVCVVNEQVFVTSGYNALDVISNGLFKVNPQTGQAGLISNSPASVGTVSDIDIDPTTNAIYGLSNNSNRLVRINGANWNAYATVGNITGLGGISATGLSLTRDAFGNRIVVAATNVTAGGVNVYSVPNTAGAAAFLTSVIPAGDLAGGHCGIGFDVDLAVNGTGGMLLNRNSNNGLGLNLFDWNAPFNVNTNSAFWGGAGVNFEDLSSDIQ